MIESESNEGFPAACNRGAAAASGALLVFLNPDAVVAEGWREAIAAPLADGSGWTCWQALVTAERGQLVNTRGGVVHFTGIAWAGAPASRWMVLTPIPSRRSAPAPALRSAARSSSAWAASLPTSSSTTRTSTSRFGSGWREERWASRPGRGPITCTSSTRGRRSGATSSATAGRRSSASIPRRSWCCLAPILFATELALLPVSAVGGWLPQKLAAWGDVIRAFPRLMGERREIQATAQIGAGEFAQGAHAVALLGLPGQARQLALPGRATRRVLAGRLGARRRPLGLRSRSPRRRGASARAGAPAPGGRLPGRAPSTLR